MRQNLILLLLLITQTCFAQFTDDFSDFDLTINPTWSGDISSFITNADTILQSNGNSSGADTLILTTTSTQTDSTQWSFYMKLDFNPTATGNFVKIYLMSDQSDLNASLNGYFLRIGETGSSDSLELWRQDGFTETRLITGTSAFASSTEAGIKVTRSASGDWKLYVDPNGGENYILQGSATDNTISTTQHFGIYCKYSTASRFDQYFFDDFFVGDITGDTIKPSVISVIPLSNSLLEVNFSEVVDSASASTLSNYSVDNGVGMPASISFVNSSTIQLTFTNTFPDGIPTNISISNIEDENANVMQAASFPFTYYLISNSAPLDVVITEIMADANPPVNLPLAEYIEIYNRSGKTFNLLNWNISDGNTVGVLPDYIMTDGSYIIICDDSDESLFTPFGDVVSVSSFPTLNDDGDNLVLSNGSADVIDKVNYQRSWYRNDLKDDGGFSLEKIDLDYPCSNALNWIASESSDGGTPGIENSVDGNFIDDNQPVILYSAIINPNQILIVFNEPMDSTYLFSLSTFSLDNAVGAPISISQTADDFSKVTLTFATLLQVDVLYTLSVNTTLTDCSGNELDNSLDYNAAITEPLTANSLIINEVLFNPKDDEIDFVEVYNPTSKAYDLSDLWLANANLDNGLLETSLRVTSKPIPILPDQYVALSKSGAILISKYPSHNAYGFIDMPSIPAYNNGEGIVVLADINGNRIDEFRYTEDWHYPLLNDVNGVSLERINPNSITQDENNWHSAAESAGFATPAQRNSQVSLSISDFEEIKIEPESFSPDNDGNNDVLNIHYHFAQNGLNATVTIYDKRGREIKKLLRNQTISNEGTWNWDGITDQNEKAIIGIYIAYIEVFGVDGFKEKFKKPFVLAGRL